MASSDEQQKLVCDNDGKRIVVVAMDDSEHSKFALNWYKENIYRPDDQVFVVYSVELSQKLQGEQIFDADVHKEIAPIIAQEKQKHQDRLAKFTNALQEAGIDGKVKGIHAKNPGEGIVKVANELKAKLIVTGTRGLGTIRRTFLGSVSDYVLQHARVPVAVCRPCDYDRK